MFAIEIEDLHKSYDDLPVLRGVSLRVPSGRVYGMLGPTGAGKSTLIHLLLGFLKPNKGSLRVLGTSDVERVRSRVGYLPERMRYHLRYTAREYLRYLGQFNDLTGPRLQARVEEELRAVGLIGAADRMLSTFSKGMLQRLGIAQALLSEPEVLLIDEPTTGLDPAGQREVFDLLADIRDRGLTIFLATHFLDEIEDLCETAGILFEGKLAAEVDIHSLRAPGSNVLISVGSMTPEVAQQLRRLSPAVHCTGPEVRLRPNSQALQAQVLRILLDAHVPIIALEPQGRPLEELYMRIVRGEKGERTTRPAGTAASNGRTAPAALPGHPPATEQPAETTASPSRPGPPTQAAQAPAPPGRPGSGETLLRELLRRQKKQREE